MATHASTGRGDGPQCDIAVVGMTLEEMAAQLGEPLSTVRFEIERTVRLFWRGRWDNNEKRFVRLEACNQF